MSEININDMLHIPNQPEFYMDEEHKIHARFPNGDDVDVTSLSPGSSVRSSGKNITVGSLAKSLTGTLYDELTDDEADAAIGDMPINYNSIRVAEAVCDAYCRLMTLTMDRMSRLRGQPDIKKTLVKTMHAAKNKILKTIKEAAGGQL